MGGEKCIHVQNTPFVIGSPPHGRGKVDTLRESKLRPRITPAWAGKSCSGTLPRANRRDHPRVGGEKGESQTKALSREGSPPRGRGKGGMGQIQIAQAGITPA